MGWLSVVSVFLRLALALAGLVKNSQQLEAGRKEQLANDVAALAKRLDSVKQFQESLAALTPEQVDQQLELDFRD